MFRWALALPFFLSMLVVLPAATTQPSPDDEYTVVITDADDHPVGHYDILEVAIGESVNATGDPALVFRFTVQDWESPQTPYATLSVFYDHNGTTWRSSVDGEGNPTGSGPAGSGDSALIPFEECLIQDGIAFCWFGFGALNVSRGETIGAPYSLSYGGGGAGGTQQAFGQDYAPGGLVTEATGPNPPRGDDYVVQGPPPEETTADENASAGNSTNATDAPDATAAPMGGDSPPTGIPGIIMAAAIALMAAAAARKPPRAKRCPAASR